MKVVNDVVNTVFSDNKVSKVSFILQLVALIKK